MDKKKDGMIIEKKVNFNMKILSRIALCLVLLMGAATAGRVQMLSKDTTVNALVKNDWIVQFVSNSDYVITYTLLNTLNGQIVTCKIHSSDNKVQCFKP